MYLCLIVAFIFNNHYMKIWTVIVQIFDR